jgi:hypothetical protein
MMVWWFFWLPVLSGLWEQMRRDKNKIREVDGPDER